MFQSYSREYEILVFDDASTDGTGEILAPYAEVTPLTVIRSDTCKGYAFALNALAREASRRTKYPRRDGMVVMQADFTDQPESLPELVKRFEGGADIVVGEHDYKQYPKGPERNLRRVAPWIMRPFVRVPGVADPFSTLRLYRVSVVRDLLKSLGDGRLITNDGWAGNVELLLRTAPLARRIETAPLEARHDLRTRESRVRPWAVAKDLYRFGRSARTTVPQARREASQAP